MGAEGRGCAGADSGGDYHADILHGNCGVDGYRTARHTGVGAGDELLLEGDGVRPVWHGDIREQWRVGGKDVPVLGEMPGGLRLGC